MIEYNMLKEIKSDMTDLYKKTESHMTDHIDEAEQTKPSTRAGKPRISWKFVSDQTASLNAIQKTIMDCIKQMNDIKRQVIELKMKEYSLFRSEDTNDDKSIAVALIEALSNKSNKEIIEEINKNNSDSDDEPDDSAELMSSVIDNFEEDINDKKDRNKEISELDSQEQNLKSLLNIYYNEIEVVFHKEDNDTWEWQVIDDQSNAFTREDIKQLYNELYLELQDVIIEEVDMEREVVYDTQGTEFNIVDYSD